MTALGVILGTAAYMAPEQAKGARRQAQRHLAFGCALFEMLTGRRAFDGDDVSDTLAAILRAEPDWSALPQSLPSTVRLVLTKCLAKDRRERFADITTPLFLLTEPALSGVQSESPLRPERRRFHPGLLAAVALAPPRLRSRGGSGRRLRAHQWHAFRFRLLRTSESPTRIASKSPCRTTDR